MNIRKITKNIINIDSGYPKDAMIVVPHWVTYMIWAKIGTSQLSRFWWCCQYHE